MAHSSIIFILYGIVLFLFLFNPDKIKRPKHFRNAFILWVMAILVMVPVTILTFTLGRFDLYGFIYLAGAVLSWLLVVLSMIEFYNAFQTGRRMTVRRGIAQARQTIGSIMQDDDEADAAYEGANEYEVYDDSAGATYQRVDPDDPAAAMAAMQGGHTTSSPTPPPRNAPLPTATAQTSPSHTAPQAQPATQTQPAPAHVAVDADPAYESYETAATGLSATDLDRAIADYTRAIRLQPDNALAYNNRANAFADRGEAESALADYNEAIRLEPGNATLYHNRGLLLAQMEQFDAAIEDQTQAIRLRPDYAAAYNDRGIAYRKKGEQAKAENDFRLAKSVLG